MLPAAVAAAVVTLPGCLVACSSTASLGLMRATSCCRLPVPWLAREGSTCVQSLLVGHTKGELPCPLTGFQWVVGLVFSAQTPPPPILCPAIAHATGRLARNSSGFAPPPCAHACSFCPFFGIAPCLDARPSATRTPPPLDSRAAPPLGAPCPPVVAKQAYPVSGTVGGLFGRPCTLGWVVSLHHPPDKGLRDTQQEAPGSHRVWWSRGGVWAPPPTLAMAVVHHAAPPPCREEKHQQELRVKSIGPNPK